MLQIVNFAKKGGVNNGNNEYSKCIAGAGRGDKHIGFSGFVITHFDRKKSRGSILWSFTIQSFVLFINKPSLT